MRSRYETTCLKVAITASSVGTHTLGNNANQAAVVLTTVFLRALEAALRLPLLEFVKLGEERFQSRALLRIEPNARAE